ncbi:MAG: signal peptidase II [Firmicutes bacterium]|nr:signal peptidase II [Candidatus Fermentithermobacillaceae bacterium]
MRYWLVFALSFAADQVSKSLVRRTLSLGQSVPILGPYLAITYVENPGGAFGLFPGALWVFIITSVASIAFGIFGRKYLEPLGPASQISLGLLSGGAMGNLADRLRFATVTDFIDFKVWPVFNLADTCVVTGSVLLVILVLRCEKRVWTR